MDNKYTKPWIIINYDINTWNEMYKKAGKVEDAEITDYNKNYPDASTQLNKDFNSMYQLVEHGMLITDPELKKEVEDWNKGNVPPVHDWDEIIGHTLKLKGNSLIIAARHSIKLDNGEVINNHSIIL